MGIYRSVLLFAQNIFRYRLAIFCWLKKMERLEPPRRARYHQADQEESNTCRIVGKRLLRTFLDSVNKYPKTMSALGISARQAVVCRIAIDVSTRMLLGNPKYETRARLAPVSKQRPVWHWRSPPFRGGCGSRPFLFFPFSFIYHFFLCLFYTGSSFQFWDFYSLLPRKKEPIEISPF